MWTDRIFQIALLISFMVHTTVLFQSVNFDFFSALKKEKKLEVRYIKAPPEPRRELEAPKPKIEPFLKLPEKIVAKKVSPPPFIDRENLFEKSKEILAQKSTFTKPTIAKPDIIAVRKKITLPPIDMNKIDNPSYISYYQIVREKIRRCAYQGYTRAEVGEVYISFIISSDGTLRAMRLSEEKSCPSAYLREIAVKSVREASPFPNFPKELDYPELSFNVVISFEIE